MEKRRAFAFCALLLVVGLAASACGSGGEDQQETSGTTEPAPGAGIREDEGEPVDGGELVVAVEAETDGWDPTQNRWAVSGHMVGQAVYDSLAMFDAEGVARPYLAESISSNEDFTVWTITLRDGVKFHDGTDLNSEAVKTVLEAHLASVLTAPALRPVEEVEAIDDLTVQVTMSTPWSSFPVALAGQVGYVPEPSTVGTDEAALRPVGTGPFVFDHWTRDSEWVGTRNESYWQAGKPHLASIEFRPIVDAQQRVNGLVSGEFQFIHTSSQRAVVDLRNLADSGEVSVIDDSALGEETFILLNTAAPPLDDVRVRRALAHATNTEAYAQVIGLDVQPPAASPFVSSSPWHSPDAVAAYPAYDLEAAKALVEEYEAENGPIQITLTDAQGTDNREEMTFVAEMWTQAGIDVEVELIEQSQHILNAVTGDYQANGWRLFGNPDPDGDYVWWDINNANPIGEFSLNFSRLRSEDLQSALDEARVTDDVAVRKDAYDRAQTIMNEQVPYIWLVHTIWAFGADTSLKNFGYYELPDGTQGSPFYAGFSGATKFTDTWLEP